MASPKRFNCDPVFAKAARKGEYVLYTEHAAIVRDLRIQLLAEQAAVADLEAETYSQGVNSNSKEARKAERRAERIREKAAKIIRGEA